MNLPQYYGPKYTTASFPPGAFHRRSENQKRMSAAMKSDRTSQRIARVSSVIVAGLLALVIFAFATGSTSAQRPSTASKANEASTRHESTPSFLSQTPSLPPSTPLS